MGRREGEEVVSYFIAVAMTTAEQFYGVGRIRWPELITGAAKVGVMERRLHDLRFAIDQPDAPRTIVPTLEQSDAAWSIELDAQLEAALGEPTAPDGSASSPKVLPTQRPTTLPVIAERLVRALDEMSDGASCSLARAHKSAAEPPPLFQFCNTATTQHCNTDACAPKGPPTAKTNDHPTKIRLAPEGADVSRSVSCAHGAKQQNRVIGGEPLGQRTAAGLAHRPPWKGAGPAHHPCMSLRPAGLDRIGLHCTGLDFTGLHWTSLVFDFAYRRAFCCFLLGSGWLLRRQCSGRKR